LSAGPAAGDDRDVPLARLAPFLRRALPDLAEVAVVRRLGGGMSCLTYEIGGAGWSAILRRPPGGAVTSRAYDFAREFGTLERMWAETPVPVPRPMVLCQDPTVIGAPFYVMEQVEGIVLQRDSPPEARALVDGAKGGELLVGTLAQLAAVSPEIVTTSQDGRGYLERQLALFRRLWAKNASREVPEVDELAGWLATHLPETQHVAAVHGDFKIDNVMFAASGPLSIRAVLDWELATAGDPLVDLGWLLFFLTLDETDDLELGRHAIRGGTPFPDRAALAATYAERTGLSVENIAWYVALSGFKLAAIMEGSYRRYLEGDRTQPEFASLGEAVLRWAHRGVRAARGELLPI
jgi:aminoglycoside phosphotransferase (APT) family kinase protein